VTRADPRLTSRIALARLHAGCDNKCRIAPPKSATIAAHKS
jgi:hypothetical protein